MKDYSEVTFVEYQKKKREMFESLGGANGDCYNIPCEKCPISFYNNSISVSCSELESFHPLEALRIVMEYEPKVDWTKVPVDTKILVSHDKENWKKRHFAEYRNGKVFACGFWIFSNAEKAVSIVENWSKGHPRKTILMDFLEKYPKAQMNEKGFPKNVCPFSLGYEESDCVQCFTDKCKDCWNRPLEEVVE